MLLFVGRHCVGKDVTLGILVWVCFSFFGVVWCGAIYWCIVICSGFCRLLRRARQWWLCWWCLTCEMVRVVVLLCLHVWFWVGFGVGCGGRMPQVCHFVEVWLQRSWWGWRLFSWLGQCVGFIGELASAISRSEWCSARPEHWGPKGLLVPTFSACRRWQFVVTLMERFVACLFVEVQLQRFCCSRPKHCGLGRLSMSLLWVCRRCRLGMVLMEKIVGWIRVYYVRLNGMDKITFI